MNLYLNLYLPNMKKIIIKKTNCEIKGLSEIKFPIRFFLRITIVFNISLGLHNINSMVKQPISTILIYN